MNHVEHMNTYELVRYRWLITFDEPVSRTDLEMMLRTAMDRIPRARITIFTMVHGFDDGLNWRIENQHRIAYNPVLQRRLDSMFYDIQVIARLKLEFNRRIEFVDLSRLTEEELTDMVNSRYGVHIFWFCNSNIDEVVEDLVIAMRVRGEIMDLTVDGQTGALKSARYFYPILLSFLLKYIFPLVLQSQAGFHGSEIKSMRDYPP